VGNYVGPPRAAPSITDRASVPARPILVPFPIISGTERVLFEGKATTTRSRSRLRSLVRGLSPQLSELPSYRSSRFRRRFFPNGAANGVATPTGVRRQLATFKRVESACSVSLSLPCLFIIRGALRFGAAHRARALMRFEFKLYY